MKTIAFNGKSPLQRYIQSFVCIRLHSNLFLTRLQKKTAVTFKICMFEVLAKSTTLKLGTRTGSVRHLKHVNSQLLSPSAY